MFATRVYPVHLPPSVEMESPLAEPDMGCPRADNAFHGRMRLLFCHPLPQTVNGLLSYRLGFRLRTSPDMGRIFYGSLAPRHFELDRFFMNFIILPVPHMPDIYFTIQSRVVKLDDAMA
jgi:hypothetical protein